MQQEMTGVPRVTDFDPVADIEEFHLKFGLEYNEGPRELPIAIADFRTRFMSEELCEYVTDDKTFHAVVESAFHARVPSKQPIEKQFDALIDLVYVALGTAYLHGFDFREGWRRVHEANMKKVRAEKASDSARGSTMDVCKPSGWVPPDLSDLV